MDIGKMLEKNSRAYPNKLAIVDGDKRLSFKELNERVNAVANGMSEMGMKKNDRAAVLMDNCSEYLELYHATAKAGVIIVPINARLVSKEIKFILDDAGCFCLFFHKKYEDKILEIYNDCKSVRKFICVNSTMGGKALPYEEIIAKNSKETPIIYNELDDVAMVLYTSGTTGVPKGAMVTHGNHVWNAMNYHLEVGLGLDAIGLVGTPLFHVGGFGVLNEPILYCGGALVIMKEFNAARYMEAIEQEKVTHIFLLTIMWNEIADLPNLKDYDTSSVKVIIAAAAPMAPTRINRLIECIGGRFLFGMGMTESGPTYLMTKNTKDYLDHLGTIGYPWRQVEIRVVDENGNDARAGETGEVILRGPTIFKGYWNRPDANAKAFRGGWFHTGDIVRLDEDGFIYFADRKIDMIKSGGENVYATEVEQIILTHPKISEVAVVGVPDSKWGEAVKAFVKMKQGESMTEEELIEFCKGRMAGFKKPKYVEFREEFPRSVSGKIMKTKLRQ